ncbi:MAG: hypothetical protein Q4F83_11975 [Eubacteriales bacterium]|nr:hypothetical protein [Eubacteriales bacterium]
MFTKSDLSRNAYMLTENLSRQGYDLWRHSFSGRSSITGEEKTFFIEFFLCNPALAGNRPILGQAPENKTAGRLPSYLMIKAGHWGQNARQIHRFVAWKKISLHESAPFSIKASDCLLSETYLKGAVSISPEEAERHPEYMCQSGTMSWHLKINKKIPFHTGYSAGQLFRSVSAFNSYWHAEGMKTEYEGIITLDGENYQVIPETSYGYADKKWGSDFSSSYIWVSSCNLLSSKTGNSLKNSAFTVTGYRSKLFFLPLKRKFTGGLLYEGKQFEFNYLKFWMLPVTSFYCRETDEELIWDIRQENLMSLMKMEIHCPKKDMLLMNYESPDGNIHPDHLWSGGTGTGFIRLYKKAGTRKVLIDEIFARHVKCTYGKSYTKTP